MAKFSMNDLLNDQSISTKQEEPGGEAIRLIPIGRIIPSEKNHYAVEDIEELAASIEAMGLMHNLVVEDIGGHSQHKYRLISGERRWRACKMLFDGGDMRFAEVPCKVEHPADNAMTELMLIHANATARELSDYEKTYQANRIIELFRELKKAGHKFEGRIRENVARMLDVSPAQVGRIESINKNLPTEDMEEFKRGEIGITEAYERSKKPKVEPGAAQGARDERQRKGASKADTVVKVLAKIGVAIMQEDGAPRAPEEIGVDVLRVAGLSEEEDANE